MIHDYLRKRDRRTMDKAETLRTVAVNIRFYRKWIRKASNIAVVEGVVCERLAKGYLVALARAGKTYDSQVDETLKSMYEMALDNQHLATYYDREVAREDA